MGSAELKFQSAVLLVKDVATSRHFYEKLLGQRVLMDYGAYLGFEGGFGIWQADYAHRMLFGQPRNQTASLGGDDFELYFETDDLDSAWNRVVEAQMRSLHPMQGQPWGQRVIRILDPDGHIIEVGEPMHAVVARLASAGMSATEISERTSMLGDVVMQILERAEPERR